MPEKIKPLTRSEIAAMRRDVKAHRIPVFSERWDVYRVVATIDSLRLRAEQAEARLKRAGELLAGQ